MVKIHFHLLISKSIKHTQLFSINVMLIYYVLLIRESVLREFAHQGIGYPMPVILRWIHIVSFGNIIGFRNKQRDIDSTVIYLKIGMFVK